MRFVNVEDVRNGQRVMAKCKYFAKKSKSINVRLFRIVGLGVGFDPRSSQAWSQLANEERAMGQTFAFLKSPWKLCVSVDFPSASIHSVELILYFPNINSQFIFKGSVSCLGVTSKELLLEAHSVAKFMGRIQIFGCKRNCEYLNWGKNCPWKNSINGFQPPYSYMVQKRLQLYSTHNSVAWCSSICKAYCKVFGSVWVVLKFFIGVKKDSPWRKLCNLQLGLMIIFLSSTGE